MSRFGTRVAKAPKGPANARPSDHGAQRGDDWLGPAFSGRGEGGLACAIRERKGGTAEGRRGSRPKLRRRERSAAERPWRGRQCWEGGAMGGQFETAHGRACWASLAPSSRDALWNAEPRTEAVSPSATSACSAGSLQRCVRCSPPRPRCRGTATAVESQAGRPAAPFGRVILLRLCSANGKRQTASRQQQTAETASVFPVSDFAAVGEKSGEWWPWVVASGKGCGVIVAAHGPSRAGGCCCCDIEQAPPACAALSSQRHDDYGTFDSPQAALWLDNLSSQRLCRFSGYSYHRPTLERFRRLPSHSLSLSQQRPNAPPAAATPRCLSGRLIPSNPPV